MMTMGKVDLTGATKRSFVEADYRDGPSTRMTLKSSIISKSIVKISRRFQGSGPKRRHEVKQIQRARLGHAFDLHPLRMKAVLV